jgi:hypothetical protein
LKGRPLLGHARSVPMTESGYLLGF